MLNQKIKYRILISEADLVGNKGAVAMVFCIIREIEKRLPGTEFIVTSKFITDGDRLVDGHIPVKILYDNEQAFDIPLFKLWIYWLLSKIGIRIKALINNKVLQTYGSSNLALSTSGISFIDNYGLIPIYHFSKFLQIPLFLGIPVIKFTQSIGPFETWYNRKMAKLTLPHLNLMISRGRHSTENLKKLGISKNVITLPDIAFLLDSHLTDNVKKRLDRFAQNDKVIGIAPNIVCKRMDKTGTYNSVLLSLCNHILEKYGDIKLLLIPHTILAGKEGIDDDLSICNYLLQNLPHGKVFIENTVELSAEETKAVISRCEFFIGSRFHALIAAISLEIPSIAIGWHWKYEELMEWAGLGNNVMQIWDLKIDVLKQIFDSNFIEMSKLRQTLNTKVPELKKLALKAIESIVDHVEVIKTTSIN